MPIAVDVVTMVAEGQVAGLGAVGDKDDACGVAGVAALVNPFPNLAVGCFLSR